MVSDKDPVPKKLTCPERTVGFYGTHPLGTTQHTRYVLHKTPVRYYTTHSLCTTQHTRYVLHHTPVRDYTTHPLGTTQHTR